MTYTEKDIAKILRYGEHITLECKLAEGGLPKSLWETYSAFANTEGGTILLGIEENQREDDFNKRFVIKGVHSIRNLLKAFWDTINSSKVNVNLLTDKDVEVVRFRNVDIIAINVPQADCQNRPVYINENVFKGTFRRNNEGDYHCKEQEVRCMIRDADDNGVDGMLIEHYTMDDIDTATLQAYRNEYEVRNPGHIWNSLNAHDFLRNLGGLDIDHNTGKEWLTLAGLMMFGKGLSVRNRFDHIRMDFLDMTNLLPGSRWSDRLTYDGMWENNLFNFFHRVLPKLYSDIKRPFRLEGAVRIDDTIVHKAVREAFTNMIIHADYMVNGLLRVEKRDREFFFSNPGNLKLPVQAIYSGHHTKARNPRLQAMFRMLGFGDNIGSGFPTILAACQAENWRKPALQENLELQEVELHLWMVSLMPQEVMDFLQKQFGNRYKELSSNEQIVLATTCLEKEVSNRRLQAILNLHPADIGELLGTMADKKKLLKKNYKGRWTTYTLNFDARLEDLPLFAQAQRDTLTVTPTDSNPLQGEVEGRQGKVTDKVTDKVKLLLKILAEKGELGAQDLLVGFNLSQIVNLHERYIRPALKTGLIERTQPDSPRSPTQKYRLTTKGRAYLEAMKGNG